MNTIVACNFFFQAEELPQKLLMQQLGTGVWQLRLNSGSPETKPRVRYLTSVQGRVVFLGTEKLSRPALLKALGRYSLPLRRPQVKEKILNWERGSSPEKFNRLGTILRQIEQANLLKYDEVVTAMRQKILADFDDYLFDYSGQAQFLPDISLIVQAQLPGFNLEDLLILARHRRSPVQFCPSLKPVQSCPSFNPVESWF